MSLAKELYEALKIKDIEKCINLLANGGIQINEIVQRKRRWTCLTEACVLGEEEIVQQILYRGADCNHKTTDGKTPLMIAADNGHTAVVDILISEGKNCDINDKDNDGNTALHYAARNGNAETMEMLLQHRAAVNEKAEDGKTPLFLALRKQHVVCAELLVQNGADVNLKTAYDEETPLHAAARGHEPRGLSLILEKCSDVNITDADKNTALHLLLKANAKEVPEDPVLECCKLLLKYKIDCTRINRFDKLAVDYVAPEKMSQVAKLLQMPVAEAAGHAPGMGGGKLKGRVKALEEGHRRQKDATEEVSGDVSNLKKQVKDVDNTVKGLKGQANDNTERIENLKDDLDRLGVRPRTGRNRPAKPQEVEHLRERIRGRMVDLRRYIQPEVDDHADFLYQERAITRAEYDNIHGQIVATERARTLVFCIERNLTIEKFNSFMQSLRRHESTRHLAEQL